ncbi:sodium:proton exchanger [Actinospica sp.]|jgi:Ca2+:H+ antiporter|uniref:calcium:proton antiporter n=1 Tax=Actinospica sp. TaxID=1872142 RepID=UPI002C98D78E|nr:sodium:proton exchanger [Actinospica sp.]HWG23233.1 sodium:proton exchanger [Actinospica sp.]
MTGIQVGALRRSDRLLLGGALLLSAVAALGRNVGTVAPFLISAAALALLAGLVGRSVDQLADRLGPGAVGVLQAGLGNLPELFVCTFALRHGLTVVVSSALIGSILGNLLLVLGLAFVVGGWRHGMLRFSELRARMIMSLLLLSVAAMFVPSLAHYVGAAASGHEVALSRIAAVVLLAVFALSVPMSLRREEEPADSEVEVAEPDWPLRLALGVLVVSALLAAYVSDLFVDALQPAMTALHINQVFAGLVIVAIAGNAVENAVGVKLAWRQRPDHALAVILNSPLQIAVVLAPALVLLSPLIGGPAFTLVFSPMLMASVGIAVGSVAFLVSDGASDWLEGATMIGLYILIAAAFWWG